MVHFSVEMTFICFPDGTYLYCQWTDVSPYLVADKGAWNITDGLVGPKPYANITWGPGAYRRYDRAYVPIRRAARNNEIFLIGVVHELPDFEEGAKDDPAFMLLVIGKKRETTYNEPAAAKVNARL